MPKKKPNIKEWLLEQQEKLEAKNKRKKSDKKSEWMKIWNEGQGSNKGQKGVDKQLPKKYRVEDNEQWMRYMPKPDPPIRKFPTSSGELYYGRVPEYKTLAKLRDMGVYLIWNLAAEFNMFLAHEKAYVPNVMHGDIEDYDVPSNASVFLKQANIVVAALKANKKVFLHCVAGHGRSGMALAAIDIIMNKHGAKQALAAARAAAGGPETKDQVAFIKALAVHLKQDAPEPEFKEPVNHYNQSEIDKIIERYERKPQTTLSERAKQELQDLLEKSEHTELTDLERSKLVLLQNYFAKHKQ